MDGGLDQTKVAVKAEDDQTGRNNEEFPDPKMVATKADHRFNDGVDLSSAQIEDHHSKRGIQDIQAGEQDEKEK